MKTSDRVEFQRGDVIWVCDDLSVGFEPCKTRTCVVVSNDIANRFAGAITVVPTRVHTPERAAREYVVDLRKPRSTLEAARPRRQCLHDHDVRSYAGRAACRSGIGRGPAGPRPRAGRAPRAACREPAGLIHGSSADHEHPERSSLHVCDGSHSTQAGFDRGGRLKVRMTLRVGDRVPVAQSQQGGSLDGTGSGTTTWRSNRYSVSATYSGSTGNARYSASDDAYQGHRGGEELEAVRIARASRRSVGRGRPHRGGRTNDGRNSSEFPRDTMAADRATVGFTDGQ